jgi:hypothetical protein
MSAEISLLQLTASTTSCLGKYTDIGEDAKYTTAIPLNIDYGETILLEFPRCADIMKNMYLCIPECPSELFQYQISYDKNCYATNIIKEVELHIGDSIIYSLSGAVIRTYNNFNKLETGQDDSIQCLHRIYLPFSVGYGIPLVHLTHNVVTMYITLHKFDTIFNVVSLQTQAAIRYPLSCIISEFDSEPISGAPPSFIPEFILRKLHKTAYKFKKQYHIINASLLVTYNNINSSYIRGMIQMTPMSLVIEQFREYPAIPVLAYHKHVSITIPTQFNIKCLYWYFLSNKTSAIPQSLLHKPVTHISLILNNLATTKLSIAQIPHCINQ